MAANVLTPGAVTPAASHSRVGSCSACRLVRSSNFDGCRSVPAAGSAFQNKFCHQRRSACAASADEDRAIDTEPFGARAEFTAAAAAAEIEDEEAASPRNVWDSKPFWCQPWSIWTTGMAAISFAWQASGSSLLITGLVAVPVFVWWYLFLFVMPASYAQYMEELAAQGRQRQ